MNDREKRKQFAREMRSMEKSSTVRAAAKKKNIAPQRYLKNVVEAYLKELGGK